MTQRFPNGVKIKDLKEFLANMPDTDDNGEPAEVWIGTGMGLSNEAVELITLNKSDLMIEMRPINNDYSVPNVPDDVFVGSQKYDCVCVYNKGKKTVEVSFGNGFGLVVKPGLRSVFPKLSGIVSVKELD